MSKKMKKLLYRSFDSPLSVKERLLLENTLNSDGALRKERDRISELRRTAVEADFPAFTPDFTRKVMTRIMGLPDTIAASPELFYTSLAGGFRRLAWAGALAVAVMVTLHLLLADSLALENAWLLPDLSIQELLELTLF